MKFPPNIFFMLKVPDTLQEWNLGCSEQQTLTDWTLQVIRWLRMSSTSFSPRVWLIWLHPQQGVGSLLLQFFAMEIYQPTSKRWHFLWITKDWPWLMSNFPDLGYFQILASSRPPVGHPESLKAGHAASGAPKKAWTRHGRQGLGNQSHV